MRNLFFALHLFAAMLGVPGLAYGGALVFKDVKVSASVSWKSSTGDYIYGYQFANPATNSVNAQKIYLDVTVAGAVGDARKVQLDLAASGIQFDPAVPMNPESEPFKSYLLGKLAQSNQALLPVALDGPPGWIAHSATMHATAGWTSVRTEGFINLPPGRSLGGFTLTSAYLPAIRIVRVSPDILLLGLYPDVDDEDEVIAAKEAHIKSLDYLIQTLAPSGVDRGSFAHWNQLREDLARAVQLGWFPDAALASALTAQLADARAALELRDYFLVHQRLAVLLATINAATPAQRTSEGYALVYFNAKAIDESTGNNIEEPDIRLTPRAAGYSLGATHTATVKVVDLANGNQPMAGLRAYFYVASGPHQGEIADTQTDAGGWASASYVGVREGIDNLRVRIDYCGECSKEAGDTVDWVGGPDLSVPFFTPPVLISGAGRNFFVNDITENVGSTAAAPSVTRYYIFPNQNLDPAAALPLGERAVPALPPGESSRATNLVFTMPVGIAVGGHYLAACADADQIVVELDETNNCSFNKLENRVNTTQIIESPNQPPDCGKAAPSMAVLWPPNHKLATVTVRGVTDPDNNPVNIRITGITQDEPVNGLGDGDSAPDGLGIGTGQAQLRAERSGTGNGRVYAVSFTADDGQGGTCSSSVRVGVPHDQGKGAMAVDDGQIYDSTAN
ncbi:MAG: hypothetical protein KGZ83_11420 [Sulfuricella sp.]|nr:hypothetical protein [Sulfuricella sp.]